MLNISDLLDIADLYARHSSVEEKTVSSRVFKDSKKLTAIRGGSDITVGRYNQAMRWFSVNWPEGLEWPPRVPRPDRTALAADLDDQLEAAE